MVKYFAKETDDLNAVLNQSTEGPLTVVLPQGCTYVQKVIIERDYVEILGNNSKISWADHNGMRPGFGTGASATLTIAGSYVTIRDLVVENSFDYLANLPKPGEEYKAMGRQAVAVFTRPETTGSLFEDCTFLSWQDTLFADAVEESYRNCTIKGNIDFIFGRSHAVFEDCTIVSLGEGFVTAPSTPEGKEKGLCFIRCNITCTEDVPDHSVYLGRPWHPSERPDTKSYVSFTDCTLDRHINPAIWTRMMERLKGIYHYPEESRFSIDDKTLRTLK